MVILLLGVFNNDNTKVSFDIDYPIGLTNSI